MNIEIAAGALLGWASLATLLIFWFKLYPETRIEEFRQRMFELRNRLFDEAARGAIEFSDAPYGVLRTTINGLLRDAERVRLLDFAVIHVAARDLRPAGREASPFRAALSSVSGDRQKLFLRYNEDLTNELIAFMIKRSLFTLLLAHIMKHIDGVASVVRRYLQPRVAATEAHAYEVGRFAVCD